MTILVRELSLPRILYRTASGTLLWKSFCNCTRFVVTRSGIRSIGSLQTTSLNSRSKGTATTIGDHASFHKPQLTTTHGFHLLQAAILAAIPSSHSLPCTWWTRGTGEVCLDVHTYFQ